jgi:hypothetical protein
MQTWSSPCAFRIHECTLQRSCNDGGFAQVICPTADFPKSLSSPFDKNISLFQKRESGVWFAPSRAHSEGRIAIVTDVGCGVRWTRWHQLTSDAEADDKGVWS